MLGATLQAGSALGVLLLVIGVIPHGIPMQHAGADLSKG
jgi:hypothetical protein